MTIGDVERLRGLLRLSDAPLTNANLVETLAFFRRVLATDPFGWINYLRGIDFHRPVGRILLFPQTRISRHRSTTAGITKPFVYFTKPGTSPTSTGTTFPEPVFERFEVVFQTPALQSYASAISFDPSDRVSRMGGGIQYIMSLPASQLLRPVR